MYIGGGREERREREGGSKGDFFPHVWVHTRARTCERGARERKNYVERDDSESSGQFCASCVTLFLVLHT